MTARLILLRHGESTANAGATFTGLLDVPLTERGVAEAVAAGAMLARAGLRPDLVLSSTLSRAVHTAELVQVALGGGVPVERTWRLVERNYGALTGIRRDDARAALGDERFFAVRRTLEGRPPPMSVSAWWTLRRSPALRGMPWTALGRTESLARVMRRERWLWTARILPVLGQGGTVLVVAHGNSLRALCACIDGLTGQEVAGLDIPTGQPLIYRIDGDGVLRPRGGAFLDPRARLAAQALAAEGGT